MQVVGLDIGYSNLKLAYGQAGSHPKVRVLPAMAAPVEHVAMQLEGRVPSTPIGIPVQVDGQDWIAGVRPTRVSGWSRALHAAYAESDAYRALWLAALTVVNTPRIDRLVTGLPVAQAMDPRHRAALRSRLVGRHATGIGVVEVADVRVIAQPVGTFVDALVEGDDALIAVISEGTVLILDVGFFSVDWAVLVQGDLRRTDRGTSLEAMSVVIERAAELIGVQRSGQPASEVIERALAEGRDSILYQGERVGLRPFLQEASTETARIALEALRQDLRREQTTVDRILVTGGGSDWFAPVVLEVFDPVPVEKPRDPVTANVRGYFVYGGR